MDLELKLEDRIQFYNDAFPKYPEMYYSKGWIIGEWVIGNCYKGSGFHGSFPYSYLKRLMSLFPDMDDNRILQLFSGSLDATAPGIRMDIMPERNPDIVGDAHKLSEYFEPGRFDLIIADCPYTDEDANKYGTPMVTRNKVVAECAKVLSPGGFLCFFDQVLPMYSSKEMKRVGSIYLSQSTNHRVRCTFIFQRQ